MKTIINMLFLSVCIVFFLGLHALGQLSYECEGQFRAGYECSNAVDGDWTTSACPDAYGDSIAVIENHIIPEGAITAMWRFKILRNNPDISIKAYYWDYSVSEWILLHEAPENSDWVIYTEEIPANGLLSSPLKTKMHVKNANSPYPLQSGEYNEGVIDWIYAFPGSAYECEGQFRAGYECSNAVDGNWTTFACADAYGDSVAVIENHVIPYGINGAKWNFRGIRNYPGIEIKSYCWDYMTSQWEEFFDVPVNPDFVTYTVNVPANALLFSPLRIKMHLKNAISPLVSSEYYEAAVDWVYLQVPTLTTAAVCAITETTAQCGGTITSDGGAAIIARGVCWSTNPTPTVTDDTTNDGTGTGSFTSFITGLMGKTIYYVRAYATNNTGTGYGNEVLFITTDSMGTVTDIDGNSYRTVKIGDQWWMAENLQVTRYRNGEAIPNVTDGATWEGLTTGAYCNYNNNEGYVATYGRLYNWYAVDDGRNIAPEGWHVPTDAEWQVLVDYLGGYEVAGGKLKETGTTHWMSPNTGATDESGFTARPSGDRDIREYHNMGLATVYWSFTEENSLSAWIRILSYNKSDVGRDTYEKAAGFSVRCVKDPIDLNTLYISPTQSSDSEHVVPLRFSCLTPTAAYQVGLCWEPTDFELKNVSFAGSAVENWGFKNSIIDNGNQNVLIYALVGQDFSYIMTGEDTVLVYLHFANPLNTYDSVCILEPYISTDSLALVLDTCTINGEGLLFLDTFKIPEPGVFYPNVMFDTSWAYSYPDYAYTPGNVNADFNTAGEPIVNLIDILYSINYVYGNPPGPAPRPPSSGDVNGDCVVNLLDILLLINCKYGNPPVCDFVCGCVESSPLNKIGSTMQKYSDAPYGGAVSTEYAEGKTIVMLDAADVIKGIEMEIRLPDISANVSCPIEGMQVYSRYENDMIKLALFDINGQYQIDKGKIILLEIDGTAEIMSAFAGGQNAAPLYLEVAGSTGVSPTVPTRFALHQNHPNPFNPVTQISFELPVEAHVTLDVYNIMGQKVSTVADRKFAPGYHTVEWDGSSFASGVYFYRIQAGDAVETRKMMLLK